MEQFFMGLTLGERLSVEPDMDENRLIITRQSGERIEVPSGLPLRERSLHVFIPLAVAGLIEGNSRGSLSARLKLGLHQSGIPLPIGARSSVDQMFAASRGGFVTLGETLAFNAVTKTLVFEVIAHCAYLEPPSLAS